MRFRRRSDMFDGLSERDAARLRAALGQAQPTPGMEGLSHSESNSSRAGDREATTDSVIRSSDVLPRKRGVRA